MTTDDPSPYGTSGSRIFDRSWKFYNNCTYKLFRNLLDTVLETPTRILDIGCGTGNVLQILRKRFSHASLHGIDPSESMLEQAHMKTSDVHFIHGTIEDIPEGEFDLIVSVSMFHYLTNPDAWLKKAQNLLKKDGYLLLIDWNASVFPLYVRRWWLQSKTHIAHVYTVKEMLHLLRDWKIVTSGKMSCCFGWWPVQGYLLQPATTDSKKRPMM